jgi:PIN domain nuclease of toxin-antitoxin system
MTSTNPSATLPSICNELVIRYYREFERFPPEWRNSIESASIVGVSPFSCYEIALANQKGRLNLPYLVIDRY